jgi:hypothetical protein
LGQPEAANKQYFILGHVQIKNGHVLASSNFQKQLSGILCYFIYYFSDKLLVAVTVFS